MVALFLLISFAYFHEPVTQGLVLGGHDSDAAAYQGREQADYRASHDGETSRWTNAMFSGMPTFQIAPSYSATAFLAHISDIYNLGTKGVLCYVFVFLLGFYVMLRAFNFKPYLAALGAIVWAFSSYFFIIIAAGHIWKVMTLAYIPPTIGGLVLCYRGKLLWGGAVTALFTAIQVLSNHVQMTYYFLFVMLFIVLGYGIQSLRGGKMPAAVGNDGLSRTLGYGLTPKKWLKATGVAIIAGMLGVAANLPNLLGILDVENADEWYRDRQIAKADSCARELVWAMLEDGDIPLLDGLTEEDFEWLFYPEEDFYLNENGDLVFFLQEGLLTPEEYGVILCPIPLETLLDEI